MFAYFLKLCKDEAESEGESIIPIDIVDNLPTYFTRILQKLGGGRIAKVAAV